MGLGTNAFVCGCPDGWVSEHVGVIHCATRKDLDCFDIEASAGAYSRVWLESKIFDLGVVFLAWEDLMGARWNRKHVQELIV